jgi:hypothetical protein
MCPRIGYVNDHTRFVSKFKAEWPLTARLTTVLQNAHTSFSDDSPATRPITGAVQWAVVKSVHMLCAEFDGGEAVVTVCAWFATLLGRWLVSRFPLAFVRVPLSGCSSVEDWIEQCAGKVEGGIKCSGCIGVGEVLDEIFVSVAPGG